MSRRRIATLTATVVAAALVFASSAGAAHHLIRISEVYPGSVVDPDSEFVELQLGAQGENQQLNFTSVKIYNSVGVVVNSTAAAPATLGSGADQSHILAATPSAVTEFGVSADLALADFNGISPTGGAACFESSVVVTPVGPGIDCMSWGTFTPAAGFPINPGAAHTPSRGVLLDGMAAVRSIGPGCDARLEPGTDDTNQSSVDFAVDSPPAPQNTASPLSGCPPVTTPVPTPPVDNSAQCAALKKKLKKAKTKKKKKKIRKQMRALGC
jgi:hypothetical protein